MVISHCNDILQASAGACCVCVPDEAWLDAGQMTDVTCCIVSTLLTSNLMSKIIYTSTWYVNTTDYSKCNFAFPENKSVLVLSVLDVIN